MLAAAQFNLLNDEAITKFSNMDINSGNVEELKTLRDILIKFSQEQIDPIEYSCLRSVIILRSSKT